MRKSDLRDVETQKKEQSKGKSLYPEILFHFCQKEALLGILSSSFRVSYAIEKIIGKANTREIGIPMVSFCDLRLSEVGDHMSKYGNYGIGLTKAWANKKGLNPVLYINRHSPFTDGLIASLNRVHTRIRNRNRNRTAVTTESVDIDDMNIFNVYRYIKNYEAPLDRTGHDLIKKYRFADEREWRYVPPLKIPDMVPFVSKNKIRPFASKEELNRSISHVRLDFKPDDIRYLIVERESEISDLITHLREVKGRFPSEVLDRLKSRILTKQQIETDI